MEKKPNATRLKCGHQFKAPGAFNPLHDPVHGCLVLVVIGFVLFCIIALSHI